MASIEKAGKRWRVRRFIGGKLVTIASCANRATAELALREAELEERSKARIVRGSQLDMMEVLRRWRIAKIGSGNDELHTCAAEARLRALCRSRNWLTTSAVTPVTISSYRTAGGSPRTCSFLAGVLRWAQDTLGQYVDPRALPALRAGKAGRRPSPMLMADAAVVALERQALAFSQSAGDLIHCLSAYGWRPITAARLLVRDFDAVGGAITCRVKGGDEVRHLLLDDTTRRLRARAAAAWPEEPLFTDPRSGMAWELQSGISRWCRDHLGAKVYDLKRYAISSMLDRGIPPQHIAAFTGHRTISQVLKYARSNEVRQRAALQKMARSMESMESDSGEVVQGGEANP